MRGDNVTTCVVLLAVENVGTGLLNFSSIFAFFFYRWACHGHSGGVQWCLRTDAWLRSIALGALTRHGIKKQRNTDVELYILLGYDISVSAFINTMRCSHSPQASTY